MNEPLITIEQMLGDPDKPDAVWDTETQTLHLLEYKEQLKFCKRCETNQPIDNFVRRISISKALSLARASAVRRGVSSEPLNVEPYHRNMTSIHALCNECAAKRRKGVRTKHTATIKQLSVEDYNFELQLDGRYERLCPNPFAENPPLIPLREVMVHEYKDLLIERRAEATRKAKKDKAAATYMAYTKQLYNEMQRIKMLVKTKRYADDVDVQTFCKHYLLHLDAIREKVRAERYAKNPVTPKANLFKYIDYDSKATKSALLYLQNLTGYDLEKVKPRFIPTAQLQA